LSDGEIPLGCRQETEGADNSLVSVEAIVEINLLERRQLESVEPCGMSEQEKFGN
jgi:hypothetical protein